MAEGMKEGAHSRFDFGSLAGEYDRWYDAPVGKAYDRQEKSAVLEFLPRAEPGDRLLDVGCGTGHWSAFFAEQGFVVTGADVSQEMVRVARSKNMAHASFEVADAHALPFADGEFSVTTAITSLEFVRDAEAVIREMVRCTRRPRGVILVAVLNALAPLNRMRKAVKKSPYAEARLFSPRELRRILARYGEARVASTSFVPLLPCFLPLAPLAGLIGRLFHLPHGSFVVGRIVL